MITAMPIGTPHTGPGIERPFSAPEMIEIGSLAEALEQLVLRHPEVEALRPGAKRAARAARYPFEGEAGFVGVVSGHHQPVIALRHFRNSASELLEDWQSVDELAKRGPTKFYRPDPADLERFYRCLNLRAHVFFDLLKEQEVASVGHARDGHLVPLAPTLWSREELFVERGTGDIYDARYPKPVRKWMGIMLCAPQTAIGSAAFHVKPIEPDQLRSRAHTHDRDGDAGKVGKPGKAVQRVVTTAKSQRECTEWLKDIMRLSPDVRTRSNEELWADAQQRWAETLAKRAFLDARRSAIKATEAFAWSAAGAPRKSQRGNRRGK